MKPSEILAELRITKSRGCKVSISQPEIEAIAAAVEFFEKLVQAQAEPPEQVENGQQHDDERPR